MKTYMERLIFYITIFLSINSTILAREFNFDSDFKQWIIFSMGSASEHDFSVGISYNFGFRHFYQVGLYSNSDVSLFGNSPPHITALTIGVGKRTFSRYLLAAVFIGPAYVIIRRDNESGIGQTRFSTAGILINLHAFVKPLAEIGVGLDLYGNLNSKQNAFGLRAALHFGNNK